MSIDWVTVIWSFVIGGLVAVAAVHGGMRLRHKDTRIHVAFTMLAIGLAGVVMGELLMMRARTPAEFGTIVRWIHIPGFIAIVGLVAFVHLYLRGERLWLACFICAFRFIVDFVINFSVEPNVNFAAITGVKQIDFLGERISIAVGVVSPWYWTAVLSLLLTIVFVVDAARASWRRGEPVDRRRAVVVGGGLALGVAVATINTALVNMGVHESIYLHSLTGFALVAIISHDLNADAMRSVRLSLQLETSESALRQSSRRLDLAVEAGGLGIWEWDIERDEVWVSAEGRALFGIRAGQRLDLRPLFGAVLNEDSESTEEAIAAATRNGESYEHECQVQLPGGGMRWVATRGRAEFDAANSVRLLRGVSMDVTRRKNVEEQFQRLVEAAPVGILAVDASGTITLVNAQLASVFGYAKDELVGANVDSLMPEARRANHRSNRTDYSADNSTRPMSKSQVQGLRKDGSTIHVEVGLSSFQGAAGPSVLATVVDISDRKRVEDAIRSERAFLRQVIDIVPTLIFAKDREGRFTLANKAFADMYGTAVDDLIGRLDNAIISDARQVALHRAEDLEVLDTSREKHIFEERVPDAAGRERWLQTVKRPIVSEDGATRQVLAAATDITASRTAEREIGRLRNELAHLARVTMLSELSGSIAHELNQPLTSILSNAQAGLQFLASDEPNLDEMREILQDIATDDKRAGDVIKGLRRLLKRGEVRRERLFLDELVVDVLRLVRSDLVNAGVTMTTNFAPELPPTLGERAQLQQVVLNLIMNGCDAIAAEPPSNRDLQIATVLDRDRRIRLTVSDHGRGIPAQDLERVFDPFYTTKASGLGLGLSVCRTIVSAHGGRLWAENREQGGARFTLMLPIGDDGPA